MDDDGGANDVAGAISGAATAPARSARQRGAMGARRQSIALLCVLWALVGLSYTHDIKIARSERQSHGH